MRPGRLGATLAALLLAVSCTPSSARLEANKDLILRFTEATNAADWEALAAIVAARFTYTGTQTGPMGEFPATGQRVEAPFLAIFRLEAGQVAELWVEWDNLAMLTQLGLFPPPPSS